MLFSSDIRSENRAALGYGAFTCCHSHFDKVAKYVMSQEEHHMRKSFQKEYLEFLEENHVEFKNEYVFEFFE